MEQKFFKLPYRELAFEITRKCNMKCAHCMRGEAQNHTISKEVIDKTLDEVAVATRIVLTGGEPFLEPEMIAYLFDGIIKRNIPILRFSCVTNGTIKNKDIADCWNRLTDYIAARYGHLMDRKQLRTIGTITVSDDDYHTQEDLMETVRFYRENVNEHTIVVKENTKPDETILMLGRAAENPSILQTKNVRYKVCPYRLETSDQFIETMIQIGWDGKILIGEDSSYEQQDKCNYGNILTSHMSDLIKEGILEEMISEKESLLYNLVYTHTQTQQYDETYDEDFCRDYLKYFDMVITTRKNIHLAYPKMKYEEIVDLAYDDLNVNFKNDSVLLLDGSGVFERSKAESQKNCTRVILDNYADTVFARLTLNKRIKPVKIKAWNRK